MPNYREVVGKNIKQARETAGMNQIELAKLASSTQKTISAVETGKQDTTVGLLFNIAKALGLPPNQLISGTGTPQVVRLETSWKEALKIIEDELENATAFSKFASIPKDILKLLANADEGRLGAVRTMLAGSQPVGSKKTGNK